MAQLVITIKDTHVAELINVFGETWNDQMPETQSQYANRMAEEGCRSYIKQRVKAYRLRQLNQTLDETDITDVTP